jgi:hypothetical protein
MHASTSLRMLMLVLMTGAVASCSTRLSQQTKNESNMEQKTINAKTPKAADWVSSPLRNRLKLQLNAPVQEVWQLVGDPGNMPRYSAGLRKVETQTDVNGSLVGYTCYFKPLAEGQEEQVHHSAIKWHQENKGWASVDDDDNAFGLLQSLSLLTVAPFGDSTLLTWEFHFNCAALEILQYNKDGYRHALEDISQQLIARFGGMVEENYVEGGR